MSQLPPGLSSPPPPGFPPQGIPPQGGPPPYGGGPGAPMGPSRTSGAAITSLICGILGCLLITPIIAIICGIVGISATKNPRVTGRGMAIAGLILGLLWIGGGALMGGGLYTMYVASRPVADVAKQFTSDLSSGDVTGAQALCESNVTSDELDNLSKLMQGWGTYKDLVIPARAVDKSNGQTTWTLTGAATFGSVAKAAVFVLHKESDGSYKIYSANFQ